MTDIELTIDSLTYVKTKDASDHNFQGFPIANDILHKLQHNDIFFKNILDQIKKDNIQEGQLCIVRDNILKRYVLEGNITYETTVIPRALIGKFLGWLMMN